MTVYVKVLIPAKIAENAQTTQYTAGSNISTIIDKFTATNFSASTATISVNIVTGADTSGNQNLIVKTKSLAAGETYTFPEIVGQALEPAGFISTIASAASAINIRSNGREISS
jgi:vancomycin resistance protein YoaR